MREYLDTTYRWSGNIAAIFVLAICVTVSLQVLFNIIDRVFLVVDGNAIGLVLPSYADFAGYFLATASFMAAASSLHSGDHIRVELIIQKLNPNRRNIIEIWCNLIGAAIAGYVSWWSANLVYQSWIFGDLSPGIVAIPIWIPQLSMALGMVLLTIAFVDRTYLSINKITSKTAIIAEEFGMVEK